MTITTRTASLLLLFVLAFIVSGVTVAAVQPLALRFGVAGPWVVPVATVLCYTLTFFLARAYLLPAAVAERPLHAALAMVLLVAGSLGAAYGAVAVLQSVVASATRLPWALPLTWYAALWLALAIIHRRREPRRLRLP